jgi:RimJ/RimL family protein N-acetyltransferase
MSALDDVGLYAHAIENLLDVEILRTMRNACRLYMTGDTHLITPDEQTAWYRMYCADGPAVIQVWLILRKADVAPIGFLSLRYAHHRHWPGGDISWARGKAPGGYLRRGEQTAGVLDYAVITLGLIGSERDHGYGTAIYAYAREQAGCEVRATIYRSNERSIRAALKAGYRIEDDSGRTVTLTTAREGAA